MSAATVNINGVEVSADFLAQVVAYQEAQQAAKSAARKALRARHATFLTRILSVVVGEKFETETFKSEAQGFNMSEEVSFNGRKAHVKLLVRWSDTIKPGAKDSDVSDAAASDAEKLADIEA